MLPRNKYEHGEFIRLTPGLQCVLFAFNQTSKSLLNVYESKPLTESKQVNLETSGKSFMNTLQLLMMTPESTS